MRAPILTVIMFVSLNISAQTIKGKIVDDKQHPVKFASVLLIKHQDSSLFRSALTDQEGNFRLSDIPDGNYFIKIDVVSHAKIYRKVEMKSAEIDAGTIVMTGSATTLSEVKVTSTKPFLEQKADKLIVNVEGSGTAAGSTALEVLQKVPGVLVSNDKITMVGKGTPAIYVDGRISQYTDVAQVLRDMSAANIEKIEVIANPGAKYDATGGAVINIILKRNAGAGTNGQVFAMAGRGIYNKDKIHADRNFYRVNPGISINNRSGKINLFGGYGFFYRNYFNYSTFDRYIDPNRFYQVNYNPTDLYSHNFRIGMDYYADRKNTLGVIFRGFIRNGSSNAQNNTYQTIISSGQQVSNFQTINETKTDRKNFSGNLNWKHSFDTLGTDLNVDVDYSTFKLTSKSEIINIVPGSPSYTNNQDIRNPVEFIVFKTDFSKPISRKIKLEAGAKSSFATIDNYLTFIQKGILNTNRSTEFKYQENINAVYSSLYLDMNKWQVQGGLRAEQTIAKGNSMSQKLLNRNYWQLFPSLFITRKLNEKLSAGLQYSRRVNRPSFQQQNPFVQYFDSLTYTRGNPLIKPETADGFKFSLTYQNQPFFAINYNKKHDVIVDDAPRQEGNLTYTTPENLASFENVSIELNFPLNFGKKISGYGGNQAIFNHYKADYLGATFDRKRWHWLAYWQVSYKPTENWNFEASGFYMTRFLEEFITIEQIGALNLAVTKLFWDKKARLILNVNDVLFTQKSIGNLTFQQINVKFHQLEDTRGIRLTFRYSFGNQKLKAARSRTTASDTEETRVKTN